MQKLKSVFGLHIRGRIACEPIPKSTQCDPKFMEKTNICKTHYFLDKIHEKSRKFTPKGIQKGDLISGVLPLEAPLAPQYVFLSKKCIQKAIKVPPRCLN